MRFIVNDKQLIDHANNVNWVEIRPGLKRKDFIYRNIRFSLIEYFCQICGDISPRIFMVRKKLWETSNLTGFICIDCFEVVIGKKLTDDDFTNAPCNDYFFLRKRT